MRRRVELVHQRRVLKPRGVDRRLAASQLGKSARVAILGSQIGETLESRSVIRIERHEFVERVALGPAITLPLR